MSKDVQIGDRIKVLEEKLKKSGNTLGKEAGLGNKTVDGWREKPLDFSTNSVDIFISYHKINREWWVSGNGEIFQNDRIIDPSITQPDEKIKVLPMDAWELLQDDNREFKKEIKNLWEMIQFLKSQSVTPHK